MTVRPPVDYEGSGIKEGMRGTPLDYGIMVGYFLAILGIGTWFGPGPKNNQGFLLWRSEVCLVAGCIQSGGNHHRFL